MPRVFFIVTALLTGCAIIAVGCGSSGTESTVPSGWITFESESISLSLPDSFEGGNLTDAEVSAKFDQAAAVDPSLYMWSTAIEMTDVQLLMFGPPDANGSMPMVLAVRGPFSADSLEEYIRMNEPDQGPETKVAIVSLTANAARVVVTLPGEEGGVTPSTVYWAIRKAGSCVFSVFYHPDNHTMDPIFRASADTIVLKK